MIWSVLLITLPRWPISVIRVVMKLIRKCWRPNPCLKPQGKWLTTMEAFLNEDGIWDKIMDYEERIHALQKKALNNIAIQMADDDMDKDRSTYYCPYHEW